MSSAPVGRANADPQQVLMNNGQLKPYECCICFEILKQAVMNQCGHSYCTGCIAEMKDCPLCRQKITNLTANYALRAIAEQKMSKRQNALVPPPPPPPVVAVAAAASSLASSQLPSQRPAAPSVDVTLFDAPPCGAGRLKEHFQELIDREYAIKLQPKNQREFRAVDFALLMAINTRKVVEALSKVSRESLQSFMSALSESQDNLYGWLWRQSCEKLAAGCTIAALEAFLSMFPDPVSFGEFVEKARQFPEIHSELSFLCDQLLSNAQPAPTLTPNDITFMLANNWKACQWLFESMGPDFEPMLWFLRINYLSLTMSIQPTRSDLALGLCYYLQGNQSTLRDLPEALNRYNGLGPFAQLNALLRSPLRSPPPARQQPQVAVARRVPDGTSKSLLLVRLEQYIANPGADNYEDLKREVVPRISRDLARRILIAYDIQDPIRYNILNVRDTGSALIQFLVSKKWNNNVIRREEILFSRNVSVLQRLCQKIELIPEFSDRVPDRVQQLIACVETYIANIGKADYGLFTLRVMALIDLPIATQLAAIYNIRPDNFKPQNHPENNVGYAIIEVLSNFINPENSRFYYFDNKIETLTSFLSKLKQLNN